MALSTKRCSKSLMRSLGEQSLLIRKPFTGIEDTTNQSLPTLTLLLLHLVSRLSRFYVSERAFPC